MNTLINIVIEACNNASMHADAVVSGSHLSVTVSCDYSVQFRSVVSDLVASDANLDEDAELLRWLRGNYLRIYHRNISVAHE